MGMSTYVIGIKPADDIWRKMKAIWDACKAAGIEPPQEVEIFFGGERPNESGVEVSLRNHPAIASSGDDSREFWDVDLSKLPPDVKIVRFVNSF